MGKLTYIVTSVHGRAGLEQRRDRVLIDVLLRHGFKELRRKIGHGSGAIK